MRRCLKVLVLTVVVFFATSLYAQQAAPQHAKAFATAPEISFSSAGNNFLKLPAGLYLGEAMAIARNSKGQIYVYTRSGEATRLFMFDSEGNYLREIGQGIYGFAMAHGLRVDAQDNIYAVDEGTDTVMKFSPEGRVMMVLGKRPEFEEGIFQTPGRGWTIAQEPYRFGRPTDIAFDKDGNMFIADGYTNSRVVKYDKWGKFIKAFGDKGKDPGQFNTPHSIQTDNNGNVYVADRGNSRIQVLSNDLTLRAIYDNVGAPWAVCITPGAHQYLYSSNSNPDNNNSIQGAVTGEIYKMELDGTVLGKFGHTGKLPGEFSTTHSMDCRLPNEVLTSEITSWRVQKITLKPTAPAK